jgi:hypothetical protein
MVSSTRWSRSSPELETVAGVATSSPTARFAALPERSSAIRSCGSLGWRECHSLLYYLSEEARGARRLPRSAPDFALPRLP